MSLLPDTLSGVLMSQNYQKDAGGSANPGSDVRGSIARLTARARQLLVDGTDTRVVRNGLSAYETSRAVAAETGGRARAHGHTGATQASVELFMASLGFNLQEQQRLLQQLQASQVPLTVAADVGAVAKTPGAFFPDQTDNELGNTLEAFVANRRHDIMRRSMEEMHRRVGDLMLERSAAITRVSWEKCCVDAADAFESFSLRAGTVGDGSRSKLSASGGAKPSGPVRPRAGITALLNGRDAASMRTLNKIAAFAKIVYTQPPLHWIRNFASHVVDDAPSATDDLALLWTMVEQILEPVIQLGSSSTIMTFVASSRQMMERKALVSLLSRMLKVEPSRLGDWENMDATRFVDNLERYMSSQNAWAHIYTAMRCGRYDVASIVANNAGFRLVKTKLEAYVNASMTMRSKLPPAVDLRPLYEEEATREDPHRQLVLLLLLVGDTGEGSDVVLSTIASLTSHVARSLDETLWIRLFFVRSVEVQGGDKVKSLAEVQRLLLDDMQQLLELVRGDVVRLASLLIHAMLPSSGLRLLIECDSTYVDGIHLAMCFHNLDLLRCGDVEVPIDLTRLIPQYCSLVMLDTDKRYLRNAYCSSAVFHYFLRTNLIDTFVDYCGNELVCGKLFGQRGGGRVVSDGALLVEPPSPELLDAMGRVAEAAVARGQTELAVHVFTVLEHASSLAKDDARGDYALSRALQVVCPALAYTFQQPPSSESTHLFMHAAELQEHVARSDRDVPAAPAAAFRLMWAMGEVYLAAHRGEAEAALRHFSCLPFVPATADDVERCAEVFDATPESIATAAPPIVALAVRSMLRLAEELRRRGDGGEAGRLQRRVQIVVLWVRRWKRHVGRQLLDELASLEKTYAV